MRWASPWWLLPFALLLVLGRGVLEGGMLTHMGVELPLLVALGAVFTARRVRRRQAILQWGRRYRSALMWFALFTLGLWMVPRLLDASLHDTGVALGKWLSLPLAGAALALAWRHLPWLLRAVLHLEAIATLLRLGWLYLAAQQRYCVNYGLDDQQRLGYLLLGYAVIYGGVLGLRVMFAPAVRRPL